MSSPGARREQTITTRLAGRRCRCFMGKVNNEPLPPEKRKFKTHCLGGRWQKESRVARSSEDVCREVVGDVCITHVCVLWRHVNIGSSRWVHPLPSPPPSSVVHGADAKVLHDEPSTSRQVTAWVKGLSHRRPAHQTRHFSFGSELQRSHPTQRCEDQKAGD